jgi:hypothetical protein
VAAILVVPLTAMQQVDTIGAAGRGEVPTTEVRDGYVFLTVLCLLVWRFALHPRVTLQNGRVEVRNPLGRHRFMAVDVQGFEMTGWGLRFHLSDGRRPYSIVFQDTAHLDDPRWYDLAEAITGRRPASR